jgi:hypothetical protein
MILNENKKQESSSLCFACSLLWWLYFDRFLKLVNKHLLCCPFQDSHRAARSKKIYWTLGAPYHETISK